MSAPARLIDGQRLEDRPVAVDPAVRRGRLDHRVLAADLVGRDRHVDGVAHRAHHVEVGQRRLDHHDVGALGDVQRDLAQRLAAVRRRPAGRCGGRRTAARTRPPRGTGRRRRRRTSPRRRGSATSVKPALVERRADGADLAVHHPAGPTSGRRPRPARPPSRRSAPASRRCRPTPSAVEHAAVPVVGELVQAQVGHQHRCRRRPRRAGRRSATLSDAVRVVGPPSRRRPCRPGRRRASARRRPASTASSAALRSESGVCCTTPGIEAIGTGSVDALA